MKKVFLILVVLMLDGCFFSTKNSIFYLLESTQNTTPLSNKNITIAVSDIVVPDYLQKPQIVLQKNDSPELKISEFNRWASDLESMVQNTLIEDLQSFMPRAKIKPLAYGVNAQYTIKINIEKLSGWFGQNAVLKGMYQIMSPSGKILKQKDFELQRKVGKTYADYVKVQSLLLSDLAEILIKAI